MNPHLLSYQVGFVSVKVNEGLGRSRVTEKMAWQADRIWAVDFCIGIELAVGFW